MNLESKIYIAGHRGMVGSALVSLLQSKGYRGIVVRTHAELDLLDQKMTHDFLQAESPDVVIIAAARVGGIHANNTYRGQFIYENLMIETNLIHGSHEAGVEHLMFLGSSCIYPREAPQPIKEEYLLTGPLEQTNESYAVAKIAGIKLCESYNHQYGRKYISVMPTNLYGPHDNFDLQTSHVMPALMRKIHEAKVSNNDVVTIWGSGKPRREFLHVKDMADACVFLLEQGVDDGLYNIGVGSDVTITELAGQIRQAVGFVGSFEYDASKPDGTMRKMLDVSRLTKLGWQPKYSLAQGIAQTYQWYLQQNS